MKKTIVLFDMDGTLTESREKFNSKELAQSLMKLSNFSDIGVITGSDEDYLREQLGDFISSFSCRYKMHLLPCNGTKYYKPPESADEDFKLIHEVSMEDRLGPERYRELICELIYSQTDICHAGTPLTGHFINCRGSMINWSPIGRNANSEQRNKFIELDKANNIRKKVIEELRSVLELKDLNDEITIKFGGDTSFDIYPKGWDKTYGLKHFSDYDIWFVGDRCGKNGNDYEIYQKCIGQSYVTNGPENTIEIIDCIINNIERKK